MVYTQIATVNNGEVLLRLPFELNLHQVEIIVKPIEDKIVMKLENADDRKKRLRELLLSAPVLTDDELSEYKNVRKEFDKWQTKKF